MSDLEQLVDELGRRSLESRLGRRGFPDAFDGDLWRNLEETGLSRLTTAQSIGIRLPRPRPVTRRTRMTASPSSISSSAVKRSSSTSAANVSK